MSRLELENLDCNLQEGNKKELKKDQPTKKKLKEIAPTELRFPNLKYHSLYWRKYGTYQPIIKYGFCKKLLRYE